MMQEKLRSNQIWRNIIMTILVLSSATKIYSEQLVFAYDEERDKDQVFFSLIFKFTSIGLITLRVIALITVLIILGVNVWFFAATKNYLMVVKRERGLSVFNYMIVSLIFIMMFLRLAVYLVVNYETNWMIYQFSMENPTPFTQTALWIVCRGIFSPIFATTELTLVCYMIYHQDRRNRME